MQDGKVEYSLPRAVQVREDNNFINPKTHTAIHGEINLTADTLTDLDKILNGWGEIIHAINLKVEELIGRE